MVAIKEQLVASRTLTSSGNNPCNYITIHETANTNKGANAQAHANLQSKGNSRTASWHYQVDDKEIIQSYPDNVRCWHAGDGNGKGNSQSIGIEICVNEDGDFKKAVKNAVDLVKRLMKKHNIPVANVVQHNNWSGKNCPRYLRNGSKGIDWNEFIKLVKDEPVKTVVVNKPIANTGASKPQSNTNTTKKYTSIVDYLNANKIDSSFNNRKKLASANGIKNYTGTAAQNIKLLDILQSGKTVSAKPQKTISQMADEVIKGLHGNGRLVRQKSLGVDKATYDKVQAEVNKRYK